jgi:hypothetical protein
MMKVDKNEKIKREKLNVRFQHLIIYGPSCEDGKECDLRKAADVLRTTMKDIAEELEEKNGVATINGFDVYQAKVG